MANASEASQSELIALFRGVRDRLNESTNAGPINLIFSRGGEDIQIDVVARSGVVLRGEKTPGTDDIPTYRDAPINLLTAATDRGKPQALDYSGWTPAMAGEQDTNAPILPVYVEADPYRLQLNFIGLTDYDWFSPNQTIQ